MSDLSEIPFIKKGFRQNQKDFKFKVEGFEGNFY
jgi:hypothetical protein